MTFIDRVRIPQAERDYAISNTPLFLLGKLRSNSAVQAIATGFDANEIFAALTKSLGRKPRTLVAAVRPYAYLVALSLKGDIPLLRNAASLDAPHHDWFRYLATVLLEMTPAVSIEKMYAPGQLFSQRLVFKAVNEQPTINKINLTPG